MTDAARSWPEFPVALFEDRSSSEAQALWEGWLREARQADWHGPFAMLPGVDMIVRQRDACDVLSDGDRYPQHLVGALRSLALLNPNLDGEFHGVLDEMEASSLVNQNGSRHRAMRALFSRAFTPRSINQIRPFVTELAGRLVDAMQPGEDFVAEFAVELPAAALCELLGISGEDRASYLAWVSAIQLVFGPTILSMDAEQAAAVVAAKEALIDYGMSLLAQRRAEPRDDLVSRLACDPDRPLDDRALAVNIGDLLIGGNHNTPRALSQMVLTLTEHPDVWDAVADDPDLAETVVEECLRYRPVSRGPFRCTAAETRHRDTNWPEGQILWISNFSVNHDEEVFEDGSTFNPHRSNVREHLSFGHGAHHCIGASLARAEMQESLRVLTAAITCPQVYGDVVIGDDGAGSPVALPITFERRA
jgi:cytochrome P450